MLHFAFVQTSVVGHERHMNCCQTFFHSCLTLGYENSQSQETNTILSQHGKTFILLSIAHYHQGNRIATNHYCNQVFFPSSLNPTSDVCDEPECYFLYLTAHVWWLEQSRRVAFLMLLAGHRTRTKLSQRSENDPLDVWPGVVIQPSFLNLPLRPHHQSQMRRN